MEQMTNGGTTANKRPSLYTDEGANREANALTILGGLEPSTRKRSRGKKRVLAGLLVLAAVSAMCLGIRPATRTTTEQATAPIPAETAVATSKSEEVKRATVITETEPVVDTPKENVAMADSPAEVAAEEAAKAVAEQRPTKDASDNQHKKNASVTHGHDKANAKPATVKAAKPASPTGTHKDRDVDLVAALLAYSGKSASGQAASHPERDAAKRTAPPEPGRDIVTRTAGESTASLVQRCRALGWVEGELCRVRVCSGLWGKDAACPANNSKASAYD
jgi:hypothetical protein